MFFLHLRQVDDVVEQKLAGSPMLKKTTLNRPPVRASPLLAACAGAASSKQSARSHETASESTDFAYDDDSHQLLLSTGELISAGRGRVVATWPVLDGCCCVRSRPEGGFAGASKAGMIGVWDVEP